MTYLEKLVFLYRVHRLPSDIKLVYVPMERTAYGDWHIAETYVVPKESTTECELGDAEYIKIEYLQFENWGVFAGYGEETRTLVIGKEEEETENERCPTTTKKADVVAKWKGEAWAALRIKYVMDCYKENCPGEMKEIRRCDWWGDFIEVELCCEECGAKIMVEIERGTLGT